MKNDKNFICISSFNDDLEWFRELDYPHIIFDKCCKGVKKSKYFPHDIAPSNLKKKYPDMNITSGELGGYNINEYLSFIISNYNNLPDFIAFIKGNIVKRHVSFNHLKRVLNNKHFTSIEEWKNIYTNKFNFLNKSSYISSEGGWLELNNNWL